MWLLAAIGELTEGFLHTPLLGPLVMLSSALQMDENSRHEAHRPRLLCIETSGKQEEFLQLEQNISAQI